MWWRGCHHRTGSGNAGVCQRKEKIYMYNNSEHIDFVVMVLVNCDVVAVVVVMAVGGGVDNVSVTGSGLSNGSGDSGAVRVSGITGSGEIDSGNGSVKLIVPNSYSCRDEGHGLVVVVCAWQ